MQQYAPLRKHWLREVLVASWKPLEATMKILLYSKAFHPMVGGVETVATTLAEMFTKLGHECEVLTPVANSEPDNFTFKVHRNPDFWKTIRLIRDADVVVSKGASLTLVPYCMLMAKPFIWIHAGYQASCVDGLGWVDGEPSPLTPKASLAFHYRKSGLLYAIKAAFKLYVRRFVSKYVVTMNVAVSDWVAMRQPFKKQIRIHNPFPLHRFAKAEQSTEPVYHFLYLGRLVSEKGVGTLIKAFELLTSKSPEKHLKLLIVGDGDCRKSLEKQAKDAGLEGQIIFAGSKTGEELIRIVEQCEIAVVPSEWEEPMGGVAVELLTAGKLLIVSRNGGLAECVGDAALLFDNGNYEMLAACMQRLLTDEELKVSLRSKVQEQLQKFDPEKLAREYINLFNEVLGKQPSQKSREQLIQQ
jgi:glycosyltransferase involved in cell wall biosynthesis